MKPTSHSTSAALFSADGACDRAQTRLATAATLPPAEPSLGHRETPVENPGVASAETDSSHASTAAWDFIHSGWCKRREATAAALERTHQSHSRILAFNTCGSSYWVLRSCKEPNKFKFAVDRCHDRLCVPCQRARATRIVANLTQHLNAGPYRLITLTLKHRDATLSHELDRLYAAFRRIRQTAAWKKRVTGGIAFLEVNRNRNTHRWHVHFHVIAEGKYFGVGPLSYLWHRSTGDSTNVDIRLIRNTDHAARYVTKYATKATDVNALADEHAFDEYVTATAGRRLIVPFGTWTKWRLLAKPTEEGWRRYCHANELGINPHLDDVTVSLLLRCLAQVRANPALATFDLTEERPPPPQLYRPPELHAVADF